MNRRNYGDSVNWITSSVLLSFLFFAGNVCGDNKEGYYGKYIGKLSQLHHGVSGDVFAVDARTLHLRNFNYDGEGPAAYFYAGNSKAPGVNGFRLRDERGTTNVLPRYRNKHITITLPEGKTLQNIRWFSVWCDEFSVNFGDVKIPKNLDFPKPQKISGLSGVHGVSSEPIVIVDAQTLLIPSFSYDGEAPDAKFWVGRGFKPSPQGIRIPDENGKELPLRRYDRKTIVLTLPGDLTIFDIGHFGVWCEAFTVDFGHVQIPRGLNIPPSLKMLGVSPQKRSPPIALPLTVQNGFENQFGSQQTSQPHSKLNCEVLWDDFAYEVRWAVAGDSIVLQLVARLENNEYMSFGLSGDRGRSRMVGGDVVVAWVDKDSLKGYAKDYYLDAKSQCSGGRGSCPDDNIVEGTDSVRLLNAALVNGYSIVTFQRSLKAQDELDKHVFTNESQPIIWAIGPLNSRKEVSYHSLTNRGDIFIDFGRPPKWNCPTPESVSDQPELDEKPLNREYEEPRVQTVQDSSRRESRPKSQVPTPAPAPKSGAWEIPSIKCYEPEDGVFYAQMGPTGGKHGYSAITGHVGWGISWYINGLLIPEINVVRGRTYTFIVEGGLDPETPARYHPFYITDDPVGGYQYKTPQERANIQIFAGAVQNKRGEVRPTGVGRLCNWTPDPNQPPADDFTSFGAYQRTLRLECDPGNPGIIQWTVEKDTPDTVYYQCYTHRYLGWKINVHDHCEGEAASEPVPAIAKAPPSLLKSQEIDSEGSETINYETRVKPDSQFLKNYFGKNQTTRGPNEFDAAIEYRPGFYQKYEEEIKPSNFVLKAPLTKHHSISESSAPHHDHGLLIQRLAVNAPQAVLLQESKFVKFAPVTSTPSLSSYLVSEEPLEGINHQGFKNFQIIPISFPQQSTPEIGSQNHQDLIQEQVVRIPESNTGSSRFQEEIPKNFQILKAQAEEKLKWHKHKLSHHGKPTNRLPGGQISGPPNRQRKPPISTYALTLQQRPFPPGMFRPPSLVHKQQKRPTATNSHKSQHHIQTKGPHQPHLNIGPASDNFNRQEPQIIQQIKLPPKQQNPGLSPHDLFTSSTIGKQNVVQSAQFALNNGFDPQSVQVEGGFKPILNTGYTPKLNERVDLEAGSEDDDNVGVIDLTVHEESSKKQYSVGGTLEAKEVIEKKTNLFKNQEPQMFEPIFIPSFPDDSGKKHQEKYKKPLINPKHRNHESHFSDPRKNGQLYVKMRPTANLIRRPFYPDIVVPPFKIPSQGGSPQLRSQLSDDSEEENPGTEVKESQNVTSSDDFRAENILEVIQMYEGRKKESEVNGSSDHTESNLKGDDLAQEEIAMADERNDFYLPPKADQFHSYDGKVVKDVDAPTLPQPSPATDVSKLPQFVPFKGVTPPLTSSVNAMSLPQLRNSKLARQDILPPSDATSRPTPQKLPFPNLSLDSPESLSQHRQKRSPDHIPGHEGHDHSDHGHEHHHDHHSSSSSNASNLLHIALASLSAFCVRTYIVL